jgi:VWFA-related protein
MPALLLLLLCAVPLAAQLKVSVTVIEPKTGKAVSGLQASDFALTEDKTPRRILSAESVTETLDIMMLLDTGLLGEAVRPIAADLIGQIQAKEQMAIVAFHSSADLVQDFTSSKDLLLRALGQVKYGNSPKVLDALYAAIDGGFQNSTFRRVVLLLTAGVEGYSQVSDKQVVRLARRNGVSIYPVYVMGYEKSLLDGLARQTGGASFNLREMRKNLDKDTGARVFEVLRGHYVLTVAGNLPLSEKARLEVSRPGKLFVSMLAVE